MNLLGLPKVMPTFQLHPYYSAYFHLKTCAPPKNYTEHACGFSISSLRMERIYNQQMMRREKQMVAHPPDYTVTLRLWMAQREAVTEEGDEDRKGRGAVSSNTAAVMRTLTQSCSEKAPLCYHLENASPFLTCARHLGDFSILTPLGVRGRP